MKREKTNHSQVLYIGKAKDLKKRVSSYFRSGAKDIKTQILVKHITDFEFISTANETEALILENNLIKKHNPKYNIRLKDDKSYPYITVDMSEPYPRLIYTRKVGRKKNLKVYGPFAFGGQISEVLKILIKSFRLRDCNLREFKSRKVPCLLYQLNQCSASCVDYISEDEYLLDFNLALNVLEGKEKKSLNALEKKMAVLAEEEKFEMAGMVRDNLETLREFSLQGKQKNIELGDNKKNIDIIAYYQGPEEVEISIYMIRAGLLLGHKNLNFYLKDLKSSFDDEFISFIFRYYAQLIGMKPDIVVMDTSNEKKETLQEALKNIFDKKLEIRNAGRKFLSLFELTKTDAFLHQKSRLKSFGSSYHGLLKLTELLKLKERPVTLECYDIAIFSGASPTASQIVFHNGLPDKKSYRHYKLQELPEGNNDFAMMKEVLTRRIPHGNLPDVFIVDGGVQQVNVFLEVLKDFGIKIPVVGIAKSRIINKEGSLSNQNMARSDERLIIPGRSNPYILNKNMALFQICTTMRNEAHRFSRILHHKLEKNRIITSDIDNIKGLNVSVKKTILNNLNRPFDEISKLSILEIEKELGIGTNHAKLIKAHFN